MTLEEFDHFCATLPHAHRVIQWGNSHVWKISSKVFAIAALQYGPKPFYTFKCSAMSYEMLQEQPGLRPAPYLASRGMKWIQRMQPSSMDSSALQDYLRESYRLASLNLTKAEQKRLELNHI